MKKNIKRIFCIILVMLIMTGLMPLTGCESTTDPITVTGFKLNTYVSIAAYSKTTTEVLNQALALCDTYENMFSRTKEGSLLYQVNHQQLHEIPAELAELIQYGIDYSRLSGGAFDLTIGGVSDLWDFTADDPQVPDAAAIAEALTYVNYTQVQLTPISGSTNYYIDIPEGTMIDLGAIAKGYIADKIKEYLTDQGVTRAIINLGGNVLCIGSKTKSSDFNIGVKKPFTENESLAVLNLNDYSAVSSGVYERYFYKDGQFYHHILDPSTGYSYDNGLTEVTIISKESTIGDCLSTTCFVLGLDQGMELIESLDDIEAIFVTSDGNIHYTSGISKYLTK